MKCATPTWLMFRHHWIRKSPVKRWNIRSFHWVLSTPAMSTDVNPVCVTHFHSFLHFLSFHLSWFYINIYPVLVIFNIADGNLTVLLLMFIDGVHHSMPLISHYYQEFLCGVIQIIILYHLIISQCFDQSVDVSRVVSPAIQNVATDSFII